MGTMTLPQHLAAIAAHRKAIFDYFGIEHPYYEDIDDQTDEWWWLNGTDSVYWWDSSNGKPEDMHPDDAEYAEDIIRDQVHVGADYTLARVDLGTGENAVMLFDNSKKIPDPE